MGKSSRAAELFVDIDRSASTPLRWQLALALREAIKTGQLTPETSLPSSRTLALDLGVSRGVVSDAYGQLEAEGYVVQRPGAVPTVRQLPQAESTTSSVRKKRPVPVYELVGTVPDLTLFPRREWLAALRHSLRTLPDSELSYGDPRGTTVLRGALADYLGRVRGVSGTPDRIMITHGYTQGLSLVCRVLMRNGARRVAVENPSDDDQWDVIRRAGLELAPCPVDQQGIRVECVAAEDVDAVVVTPAHQFPTGAVLAAKRRAELAQWANEQNRIIIEDDYDSAYRYDRDPIGTLQGLVPANCVQIGSVSKILAPTLRLGWVVAPANLMEELGRERWATDAGHRAIDQRAFAAFITRGDLDRHVRRTRQAYRIRRDRLVSALTSRISDVSIEGIAAGLHLVLRLPRDIDEGDVCDRLERRRIYVRGLSSYLLETVPSSPALVLGYGSLSDAGIPRVATTLAQVISNSADSSTPAAAISD
jgi:GntR family transcriptional regulator/MocR family aminotransferase